jgi:hypothetical protein
VTLDSLRATLDLRNGVRVQRQRTLIHGYPREVPLETLLAEMVVVARRPL